MTPDTPTATDTAALSAAFSKRLDLLESRATQGEREALVERASREGKVIPLSAELIAATSVAVLTALVAGLPAGAVPLDATHHKVATAPDTAVLSADESQAAQQLGLTPEQYAKGKVTA